MSQFFEGYSLSLVPGALVLGGSISPAALALGLTSNYSPTGLSNVSRLRVTTNVGGSSIGGLPPQMDGFFLIIENLGPGDLTLVDEDPGSTVGWKFALPSDFTIPPDYSQTVIYELADAHWRIA
jgi:hypothetical protein